MADLVCTSCRQFYTIDPSGLCEDCQEGIPSSRPGSVTARQLGALAGLMIDQGMTGDAGRRRRADLIREVVPGWPYAGDLGALSQAQAADVLQRLAEKRLSQEARGL